MSERETRGANEAIDFNDELRNRREKLAVLRQQGVAFPNDFRRDHTSDQLHEEFDAKDNQELESLNIEVSAAGRMMTRRIMGKASFVTLQDVGGRIQLYVGRINSPADIWGTGAARWTKTVTKNKGQSVLRLSLVFYALPSGSPTKKIPSARW